MLLLDRRQIEASIDYEQAVVEIESAYRGASSGEIHLPPVGHITFPEHQADCHIKYGHRRGEQHFVIKVATGFPGNAARGLPTGNGLVLVLSAVSGEVLAVLHDEMVMTDIRTGIGGAIATRTVARPDARRVLIVGTGIQARRQIEAHRRVLFTDVEIAVWGRDRAKAQAVKDDVGSGATVALVDDLEAACRAADVIVTTTGASSPLIRNEWIRPGTHITAVGADAPGKQELESALVARADVLVTDSTAQCLDHGELSVPFGQGLFDRSCPRELGAILLGHASGRSRDDQVTVADLTGLAAQDIAIAKVVLASSRG